MRSSHCAEMHAPSINARSGHLSHLLAFSFHHHHRARLELDHHPSSHQLKDLSNIEKGATKQQLTQHTRQCHTSNLPHGAHDCISPGVSNCGVHNTTIRRCCAAVVRPKESRRKYLMHYHQWAVQQHHRLATLSPSLLPKSPSKIDLRVCRTENRLCVYYWFVFVVGDGANVV
jgi:hypothetical protein